MDLLRCSVACAINQQQAVHHCCLQVNGNNNSADAERSEFEQWSRSRAPQPRHGLDAHGNNFVSTYVH